MDKRTEIIFEEFLETVENGATKLISNLDDEFSYSPNFEQFTKDLHCCSCVQYKGKMYVLEVSAL